MSTDAIEAQLLDLGVHHTQKRFFRLAEGRRSAWSIAETWWVEDRPTGGPRERDFLGLAACELWKRLLPHWPSVEMIDDWMQDGYALSSERESQPEVCELWWKAWCTLRPRFLASMTTTWETDDVFNGFQSLFNWTQDFTTHLDNASIHNLTYARMGRQFCTEWLEQFEDEQDSIRHNVHDTLATFLFRLGDQKRAEAELRALVEERPHYLWSYVALADAYAHLFPDRRLTLDLDKAIALLERAQSLPDLLDRERSVVERRIAEIRDRRGKHP